jgi:RNA polymerase sigma-70 factor (ECF subfamily)
MSASAPRDRPFANQRVVDDAALVARVVDGDRGAFDALYFAYFPRLTRFVERMVRRPHLVGEIVNDTMLVVWRRASTFNGQSKVSTWIFSIAYRSALHALRGLRDAVEVEEGEDEPIAPDAGPDASLMQLQDRRILDIALAALTPEHRAVVELTYFEECTCREIAQVVGCPVDTVKTRLFYARRRLRTLLASKKEDVR